MYAHTSNNSCYNTHSLDSVTQYQQQYCPNVSSNHDNAMVGSHGNTTSSNGSGCSGTSCVGGSGSPRSPLSCCSSNNHPHSYCSSPLLQTSFSSTSLNPHHVSSPNDLDNATQGFNNILSHQYHHYQYHNNQGGISYVANNESTSSIIEGMSKACRYSPQERKERIDRYRNKRTQRNFTKKIQYACRKTLADSRPRIRGRFARNDEINQSIYYYSNVIQQDEILAGGEDEQQWIHLLDYISSNLAP